MGRKGLGAAALALALLVCLPGPALAGRHQGIDVSRFQATINWGLVAGDRVEFAFLQASRGSGADCTVVPKRCGADEFYDLNYASAKAAGLRVGPYHRAFAGGEGVAGVRADAQAEAALFVASVGSLARGDLVPALDVETPFGALTTAELQLWVRVWLRRVEAALGAKPLVYTNNSSWQALANTTAFALAGHRLWVANFDVPKPLVPAANWAGRSWKVWQYTSSGSVRGVAGNVDRDVLRGGFGPISVR